MIAAAGSGRRMGAKGNKLLLPLAGRTVLAWTIESALSASSIEWIGIICQPDDREQIKACLKSSDKPIEFVNGGPTRQESVQLGLAALPSDAKYVLIHDGARCLVKPSLFNSCSNATISEEAIVAATPVTDTIKCVDDQNYIFETPDRSELWAAQTPQGFSVIKLRKAHKEAMLNSWNVTDDASLFEQLGWKVKVLESDPSNIKVTTPFDLIIAEAVLANRSEV